MYYEQAHSRAVIDLMVKRLDCIHSNTPIVFVHLYTLRISLLIIICGHFQRTLEYILDIAVAETMYVQEII